MSIKKEIQASDLPIETQKIIRLQRTTEAAVG